MGASAEGERICSGNNEIAKPKEWMICSDADGARGCEMRWVVRTWWLLGARCVADLRCWRKQNSCSALGNVSQGRLERNERCGIGAGTAIRKVPTGERLKVEKQKEQARLDDRRVPPHSTL
jgi:hypothetical protein